MKYFFLSLALLLSVIGVRSSAEVGPCPISADFVTQAETFATQQQIDQYEIISTTMRAFVDGAMVQVECTGAASEQLFPNTDDATILTNYARFWSIEPNGPAVREEEPVPHYVIEGVKEIQGIEVTYAYRLFRFSNSFAMVATAIPGGSPTPDVERFLASITLATTMPTEFTDAELADGRRNHFAACLPAIRADNETRQLGLSDVEISYFCSCTGQSYFAEFTRPELRALASGGNAALDQRKLDIQTECLEEATR